MGEITKKAKSCLSAIQLATSFLTIVPLYKGDIASEREMSHSLHAFPLVGGLIGLMLAGTYFLTDLLHMGIGGAALVVVLWLIITGGLHADGVIDTADGVFCGKERTKKLEIMKDSRVGAMGVIAFVSLTILKISFLASLPVYTAMWALIVAPIIGRIMILYAMLQFPYARTGDGLGNRFGRVSSKQKLLVTVIALVTVLLFLAAVSGWLAADSRWMVATSGWIVVGIAIGLFVAACVLSGVFAHWIAGVLHGHTGDSYGAVCEVSETATLLAVLVFWGIANG